MGDAPVEAEVPAATIVVHIFVRYFSLIIFTKSNSSTTRPTKTLIRLHSNNIRIVTNRIQPRGIRLRRLQVNHLPRRRIKRTLFTTQARSRVQILLTNNMRNVKRRLFNSLFKLRLPYYRSNHRLLHDTSGLQTTTMISNGIRNRTNLKNEITFRLVRRLLRLKIRHDTITRRLSTSITILMIRTLRRMLTRRLRSNTSLFRKTLPILNQRNMGVRQ